MAISGIGSDYNNVYESTYAAQKNEAKKVETKEAASAQTGKEYKECTAFWGKGGIRLLFLFAEKL